MIEIKNVTKRYGKRLIFDDINATFENGKKIWIKGVNGSGKSVLLKMIAGYAFCDQGTITVDGKVIGKDVDFIPDAGIFINAPEFIGNDTGMDNLMELAKIRHVASQQDIEKLAEALGLKELDQKYRTYSLGMRQKMRLIQALMDKPRYLILDEPFDALDATARIKATDLLNEFMMKDKDRTMIYASHETTTEFLHDVAYEIDDNKLIQRKE